MNVPHFRLDSVAPPAHRHRLTSHQDPGEASLKAHANAVITRLGRVQETIPLNPRRILAFGLFRNVVSLEINRGRRTARKHSASSSDYRAGGKLDLEPRLAVCVGECRRWNGIAIGSQELSSGNEVNLRLGKFRPQALQY